MLKPTDFAFHLTNYLSKYLPGEAGSSNNTILAYRDTFKLLLRFAKDSEGLKEEKLTLKLINKPFILRFLEWIEKKRRCSVATRNQRLSAIHAFFTYVQSKAPEYIFQCQEILSIQMKKYHQEPMTFLSNEGIKALLAEPDIRTKSGRKHLIMLSFIFATGCRVQEISDIVVADVMYNGNTVAKLTGKGGKSRFVPLDELFVNLLRQYIEEFELSAPNRSGDFLFKNHLGQQFTRQGVTYILKKYAAQARKKQPEHIPAKLSPHGLRHSRAVDLLRSGIELIYIRDLLGHVSVQTTEIYARVDGEMKRKALEKASGNAVNEQMPAWQSDKALLEWLTNLT